MEDRKIKTLRKVWQNQEFLLNLIGKNTGKFKSYSIPFMKYPKIISQYQSLKKMERDLKEESGKNYHYTIKTRKGRRFFDKYMRYRDIEVREDFPIYLVDSIEIIENGLFNEYIDFIHILEGLDMRKTIDKQVGTKTIQRRALRELMIEIGSRKKEILRGEDLHKKKILDLF